MLIILGNQQSHHLHKNVATVRSKFSFLTESNLQKNLDHWLSLIEQRAITQTKKHAGVRKRAVPLLVVSSNTNISKQIML